MLKQHGGVFIGHQLRRSALHHCYAHIDMPKKLPLCAVRARKADVPHGQLLGFGDVMQNDARINKLLGKGWIQRLINGADCLCRFEHGGGMV